MYKYLAMDKSEPFEVWSAYEDDRPVIDYDGFWGNRRVQEETEYPSFLRPGQLWERCEEIDDRNEYWIDENEQMRPWEGYWWRKIEDHGETNAALDDALTRILNIGGDEDDGRYEQAASDACRAAGLSLEALEDGVVEEMVEIIKQSSNVMHSASEALKNNGLGGIMANDLRSHHDKCVYVLRKTRGEQCSQS